MPIAQSLLQAYHASHYRMTIPPSACILQIGKPCSTLDNFLQAQQCEQATFISAYNPRSVLLPQAINRSRNAALEQLLQARRLPYWHGEGYSLASPDSSADERWPAEPGFLVLHTPMTLAQALAAAFEQNAVLWLAPNRPVELLLTRA